MADADGAQPGDGAPGGGSGKPGSKSTPSGDDKDVVPKSQFLAALKSANEKYRALELQVAELRGRQSAQPQKDEQAPKRYSRAELNTAVEAKQITVEQADELWANQIREDAKREAKDEVLGIVKATREQERVDTDLEEYKRLDPSIMEEGSETRQRVREEFDYLVGLGHSGEAGNPKTLQTQLLAIRSVLGPLDKLKTAKSARRDTESHQETGGASSGGSRRPSAKGPWESLDQRQKDFYEAKIRDGLYKDRAAVEAELSFKRQPHSRRSGARA